MPKVWVLQHVHCESLGLIAEALDGAGLGHEYVRIHEGQTVPPDMRDAEGLIVMGGPMGVYEQDRYPHLSSEISLIEASLREGKPVLGVCLGSQLLAAALGAPVTPGPRKEIGWHSITLSPAASSDPILSGIPSPFTAFAWHGDVFDLPQGAVSLASSALTEHQAFRYGESAYGFLLHMEVTDEMVRGMVETFAGELRDEGISGQELVAAAGDNLARLQVVGRDVFLRWAHMLRPGKD